MLTRYSVPAAAAIVLLTACGGGGSSGSLPTAAGADAVVPPAENTVSPSPSANTATPAPSASAGESSSPAAQAEKFEQPSIFGTGDYVTIRNTYASKAGSTANASTSIGTATYMRQLDGTYVKQSLFPDTKRTDYFYSADYVLQRQVDYWPSEGMRTCSFSGKSPLRNGTYYVGMVTELSESSTKKCTQIVDGTPITTETAYTGHGTESVVAREQVTAAAGTFDTLKFVTTEEGQLGIRNYLIEATSWYDNVSGFLVKSETKETPKSGTGTLLAPTTYTSEMVGYRYAAGNVGHGAVEAYAGDWALWYWMGVGGQHCGINVDLMGQVTGKCPMVSVAGTYDITGTVNASGEFNLTLTAPSADVLHLVGTARTPYQLVNGKVTASDSETGTWDLTHQ